MGSRLWGHIEVGPWDVIFKSRRPRTGGGIYPFSKKIKGGLGKDMKHDTDRIIFQTDLHAPCLLPHSAVGSSSFFLMLNADRVDWKGHAMYTGCIRSFPRLCRWSDAGTFFSAVRGKSAVHGGRLGDTVILWRNNNDHNFECHSTYVREWYGKKVKWKNRRRVDQGWIFVFHLE